MPRSLCQRVVGVPGFEAAGRTERRNALNKRLLIPKAR